MTIGIIGSKVGMTRIIFNNDLIPVTVLNVRNNFISQVKSKNSETKNKKNDGYFACQLSFLVKEKKRGMNKPQSGHFEKLGLGNNFKIYSQEIRDMHGEDFSLGKEISPSIFNEGEFVKISSKSKGKGTAGVIKRWGFKIGNMSHGGGYPHRLIGSMGGGRGTNQGVPKGKKMPGRMGGSKVTVNSIILKVDAKNGLFFVKGSIPGPKNSLFKLVKK